MPSLQELIQKRIDRLESVPDTLLTKIDKQNEVLFKALLKELNSLDVKDGKIVTSTENLAKVGGIIEKLKEVMFSGEYLSAIKDFATEIQAQASLNNDILDKVAGSFEDNELYQATIKSAQKNALLLLDASAVENNLLQPINELISNAIINNSSMLDAVDKLRSSMVGEGSIYSKYASTYVRDSFAAADRQYVQLTARDFDIQFYRYDGGAISDTREFCLERVNKVFHEKEIAKWGDNINTRPGQFIRPANKPVYINKNDVKLYWEGQNYDTTPTSIFSYVGGYQCRHILVPVAIQYVPATDLERAKALGFFTE